MKTKPWFTVPLFLFAILLITPFAKAIDENFSKAKAYDIIDIRDNSLKDRCRRKVLIHAPLAKTFEERALTVMSAAMDRQAKDDCTVVYAILLLIPNKESSYDYARAIYAPDKKGWTGEENWTWQVQSSSALLPPADVPLLMDWTEIMSCYKTDDGRLDKEAVKKRMVREFKTSPLLLRQALVDAEKIHAEKKTYPVQ